MPIGIYERKIQPLAERFWPKVIKTEGCWIWTANMTHPKGGYGRILTGGRRFELAHRVAYKLVKREIPEGMTLDHLCRNRLCVNPDHLEPVTMRENILRGESPTAIRFRRGTCDKGHPYAEGSRGRICKICKKNYDSIRYSELQEETKKRVREYYQEHKEEINQRRRRTAPPSR